MKKVVLVPLAPPLEKKNGLTKPFIFIYIEKWY